MPKTSQGRSSARSYIRRLRTPKARQVYWSMKATKHDRDWENGVDYREWLFKKVLGHGKNRLPADHPARDRGATLDVLQVLAALERDVPLSRPEMQALEATKARIAYLSRTMEESAAVQDSPMRGRVRVTDEILDEYDAAPWGTKNRVTAKYGFGKETLHKAAQRRRRREREALALREANTDPTITDQENLNGH